MPQTSGNPGQTASMKTLPCQNTPCQTVPRTAPPRQTASRPGVPRQTALYQNPACQTARYQSVFQQAPYQNGRSVQAAYGSDVSALPPQGEIQAVFFDVGNTLRVLVRDPAFSSQAESSMMNLLRSRESHEILFSRLEMRWSEYCHHADETMLEVTEGELWTRYLLPEYEPNLIYANAPRLTRLWRDRDGRRFSRPGAVETLKALKLRGYTLGIIANAVSETEVPDWLVTDDLAGCVHSTLLSAKVRLRKPDPAVFHLASRCTGVPEAQCAYVGDSAGRDADGARGAGYGMVVTLNAPDMPGSGLIRTDARNRTVASLHSLLDIFPPRDGVQ